MLHRSAAVPAIALALAPVAAGELVTELGALRDVGLASITAPAIHDDGTVATSWGGVGAHARVRITGPGGGTTEIELVGYQTFDGMRFTETGAITGTGARTDAPPTTDALLVSADEGVTVTEIGSWTQRASNHLSANELPSGWLAAEINQTNDAGFGVGSGLAFDENFAIVDVAFLWTPSGEVIELQSLLASGTAWSLRTATGINNANEIVGQGLLDGVETTYVLGFHQHAPSPGGVALIGIAAIALATRARRDPQR